MSRERIREITDALEVVRSHTREALSVLAPLTAPRPPQRTQSPRKKEDK